MLEVSPNFTIDDIHRIREYNYEATKNMTKAERNLYYDEKVKSAKEQLKPYLKKLQDN